MIDNFEQISKLLKFEDESDFYFIQVLQRNKENPELGSNNRLVKGYYIDSLQKLEKYKEEMIKLAQVFNARVYIHLNRRNKRVIALEMLEDLAHCIKSNQFELSKIYNTACGRHKSEKDKSWIIDVDNIEGEITEDRVEVFKQQINLLEPIGDKIIANIPTKNGFHLITKPFNSEKFSQMFPVIQLHKNNPTVLFIP